MSAANSFARMHPPLPLRCITSAAIYLLPLLLGASCVGRAGPGTEVQGRGDGAPVSQYVVELFEDRTGNVWFGTISDGVARYGVAPGAVAGEKSLTYLSVKDGLIGDTVASICQDRDGNMWFGTHSGLSKWDGKSTTNFTTKDGLCNDRVSSVFADKAGTLWVGTWGGVSRFDGKVFADFALPIPDIEVPPYQATANWVTEIMQDRRGGIWFGRSGYGACRLDPATGEIAQWTTKNGLSSNCVQVITEDSRGDIWLGFRNAANDHPDASKRAGRAGVMRYDGQTFTRLAEPAALDAAEVYTIYSDRSGVVWLGATGVGVYRYEAGQFTLIPKTNRMDLTSVLGLQAALEDRNGVLWLGFSGGLFRREGLNIVHVPKSGPWK